MHLLSQLGEIEREFADVLVVIGVHSPKFTAERVDENVRQAVLRYEIEHPVVNDPELITWRTYAVRAWPTLVFIDPEGRIIGTHEGEASASALAGVIRRLVDEYDTRGLLDRRPIEGLRPLPRPDTPLAFPGKVAVDPHRDRVIVADSGHHRLVVARADGDVTAVIGSGEAGLADGPAHRAQFRHPQGMALDGDALFVADTGNHAIRRVDLASGRVETVAGTGQLGTSYAGPGPARQVDLRSPWALAFRGGILYIAMAGMHQIWTLDLAQGWVAPYAGSGMEGIQGGRLDRAWLAQPSGLTTDATRLYVACSETSAVRVVDLPPGDDLRVGRLVGVGLFDFGDVDGIGDEARLQHPLDVVWHDGMLYVADSYNHKVKRLDPATRRCERWLGDGTPGLRDGVGTEARFYEPGGLAVGRDTLYVADTNNHAIRVVRFQDGAVHTLALRLS